MAHLRSEPCIPVQLITLRRALRLTAGYPLLPWVPSDVL